MSDLTRLNPTPHAIAVYASQPLSPVATQHSLPSRTLPFTWAGLSPAGSHQLCLAHSLDHLVGQREQRWRNLESERPGGPEIEHEFEFGGLHDRKIGRLLTFENSSSIVAGLAVSIGDTRSVTAQRACQYRLALKIHRGHRVARGERYDALGTRAEERAAADQQRPGPALGHGLEGGVQIAIAPGIEYDDFLPDRLRRPLHVLLLGLRRRGVGVCQHGHQRGPRR